MMCTVVIPQADVAMLGESMLVGIKHEKFAGAEVRRRLAQHVQPPRNSVRSDPLARFSSIALFFPAFLLVRPFIARIALFSCGGLIGNALYLNLAYDLTCV
jgi:hypothetical protein